MLKIFAFLKERYQFYTPILEFIFLFIILLIILHYINKLIHLPRFIIIFLTIDLFLIFPKFTINILKFILKSFFYILKETALLVIKSFEFSRIELIIFVNLILIIFILIKYLKKKYNILKFLKKKIIKSQRDKEKEVIR